jgi:hypothetical protein
MIYTQEQIATMSIKEAQSALNLTETSFQVDGAVSIYKHWDLIDSIANQLLWLEDRLHQLDVIERSQASSQRMTEYNQSRA